jgi:hypothetical protein
VQKAQPFTQPNLVVGEGKVDQFFFSKLFSVHNLVGFEARHATFGSDSSGGANKISRYLKGLNADSSFSVVRKIIVVGDNDDAGAFTRICAEVIAANYTAPTEQTQFVQTPDRPELAVLMIPGAPPGCLESLCLDAAATKWPQLIAPLGTYFHATDAPNWNSSKQAKMKVECILASTCEQNPQVALSDIWQKNDLYQIPLDEPAFQGIVNFLRTV